jgi:pyrroloquinoline quinone biosynthesis protein B
MKIIVLGSGAGGGAPEWRCACASCQVARQGDTAKPRSQDSLAVSADGERWFLLNVSPDVAHQLDAIDMRHCQAAAARRSQAPGARTIVGAVLTNGALEHSMGLLSLRGGASPLCLYATRETYAGLVVQSAVFRTLERQRPPVLYRALALEVFIPLRDASGEASGLSLCAFPVPGNVPQHLRSFIEPTDETNVGLIVRDDRTGARILYVPGASSAAGIAERARDVSCLFFDGTFWSDDERTSVGASPRLARDVEHLPVSGPAGSLEQLDALPIRQRFYTHVNDGNPMLRKGSAERRALEARGWSVAEDGLELSL